MFSSRRMMKYWEQGCADGEVRKDFEGLAVDSRVVVGNRRRLPIFFVSILILHLPKRVV